LKLFRESLSTSTTVISIDPELHEQAWDELERIGRRAVSLTDCSVGVVAQGFGIDTVFAFDPHFTLWGLRPATRSPPLLLRIDQHIPRL
jgi:predicted nucleic acid-binding protein